VGPKRPPRLKGFDYVGIRAYSLTICCENRQLAFANASCAHCACTQFLQTAAAYRFEILAYCFMPDHMHALVEGMSEDADFCRCVDMFKQQSAFEYKKVRRTRLWQEGYYDHVLRDDEPTIGVAAYILHNPVRAGLCSTIAEYPFLGSQRYTIQELIDAIQIRPNSRSRP
jgi:putative transposase